MCLIVVKNQTDASFSVEDFTNSFSRNSDGTGIAYVEDGRVLIEKAMGTLKEQLTLYYKHMSRPQFILHQRFATHGEKSELNVHPFYILNKDEGDAQDLIMAHNGVISMNKFSSGVDKRFSDTNCFVHEYLTPLFRAFPNIIDNPVFQMMLHDFIGTGNKLAFLSSDGRVWIFNKSAGAEHNGCWLSNKYSIENNTVKYNNTYTKTHGTVYNYGSNYPAYTQKEYDEADYAYEDEGGLWHREPWQRANRIANKAQDTMTHLDADGILEAVVQYAGMPVATLEDLVKEDAPLTYDMMNILSVGDLPKTILDEKPTVIANKLYDLLQEFSKKEAA
jgi:predicted glutamine amidotransferase